MATSLDLEPQFTPSQLGLLCARAMIRVGLELKGMVVAGCISPESLPPKEADVLKMAEDFGVPLELKNSHISEIHRLNLEQRQQVLSFLQRIAHIVAHIVNERKSLLGRLTAIADLTTL